MPSASRKDPVACRASSASASGAISMPSWPGDALQHGCELLHGRAAEVEAVAAVDDGRQHLLRLGRGEHEDGSRRRLLERLEERVPRLRGQHVRLVEDVDLRAARDRCERDLVAQLADVVDGVVRRGVHLDHVERRGALNRHTRLADPARLDRRPVHAVHAGGEDLRHRRLAGPARAHEQVGVMHLSLLDRVAQRADDMLLPDDVREGAGTVTTVERGAGGHEGRGYTSARRGPDPRR